MQLGRQYWLQCAQKLVERFRMIAGVFEAILGSSVC